MPRLFFALYPDAQVREHLVNLTAGFTGFHVVKAENLHLTLHFIGQTNTQDCLINNARKIHVEPFSITINQFGLFRRARVLWVGPTDYSEKLTRLAAHCSEVSKQCGEETLAEMFTPHISLIRKIKHTPEQADFETFEWTVDSFCLMISESDKNGVQYRILETFSLDSQEYDD